MGGVVPPPPPPKPKSLDFGSDYNQNTFYFVDGEKVSKEDVENLKTDDIEHVDVMKEENSRSVKVQLKGNVWQSSDEESNNKIDLKRLGAKDAIFYLDKKNK